MKVAAACYPVDWHDGYLGLVEKYDAWVGEAARAGADLLVFPEYAAMELAAFAGRAAAGDIRASMEAVSEHLPEYWDMIARLARRHGVHILAGSGPCCLGEAWVNRAMFATPSGGCQAHDKQIMTRWERDPMGLGPGAPLVLMETALGRIGVLICHDAEFPLLARGLVEAAAEVLLVPSKTEAVDGFARVRIGARARALEGQCVVVQAPVQGRAPWNPVVDENRGAAGIYGPPDLGFPHTGVIAQGEMDRPGWVYGEVDREGIRRARDDGHVLTRSHWAESSARAAPVQTVAVA